MKASISEDEATDEVIDAEPADIAAMMIYSLTHLAFFNLNVWQHWILNAKIFQASNAAKAEESPSH